MREREGARARRTAKVRERERMWILQNIKNLHNKKKNVQKNKNVHNRDVDLQIAQAIG